MVFYREKVIRENLFLQNLFFLTWAMHEVRKDLCPQKLVPVKIYAFKVIGFIIIPWKWSATYLTLDKGTLANGERR